MQSRAPNLSILLVEDNPADVRLTREALAESQIRNTLHVVHDGEAALAFLTGQAPYESAPRPDLILLDLNLPRKDGREVLAELKQDPDLRLIPVVVLTTSGADSDVLHAYRHHANCYVRKPVDFDHFVAVVRAINDFWASIVRLPCRQF